jgi:ribosomal 50S subunit-associated protein YjgA (DUF615 family)
MRQSDLNKLDTIMTKLKQFNDQNLAGIDAITQTNVRFVSDGSAVVVVLNEETSLFEVSSVSGGGTP